jgi:uncharacterized membrane protein
MENRKGLLTFGLYAICAAAFVYLTGLGMPDLVASHFGATGAADGFMPRGSYLGFMILFIIGFPALLVFATWHVFGSPHVRINLPNRAYWLAPERRAQTIAYLRRGVVWFGVLLVAFLCYAHWLVVLANTTQPPHLAVSWMFGGLGVFLVALVIWLAVFLGRFRRSA